MATAPLENSMVEKFLPERAAKCKVPMEWQQQQQQQQQKQKSISWSTQNGSKDAKTGQKWAQGAKRVSEMPSLGEIIGNIT